MGLASAVSPPCDDRALARSRRRKRLVVAVAHDEAGAVVFDVPRRKLNGRQSFSRSFEAVAKASAINFWSCLNGWQSQTVSSNVPSNGSIIPVSTTLQKRQSSW
jgi:hypothetical protein